MTDQDFYRTQNRWSQVYFRDISQVDREKVFWINRITRMSSVRVLELGAGGGQFSVAACQQGHQVTAIEIEPDFVDHIEKLSEQGGCENLTILNANFYSVALKNDFDIICYWDGFGIGSDRDQRRLLERISSWLAPGGSVFLEIFTPWYWANEVGDIQFDIGDASRQYGFDAEKCVMTDTWWLKEYPTLKKTQHLRCYSPADLVLLLENSGLKMVEIFPGGKIDNNTGKYTQVAPLRQAMSYIARLVHTESIELENKSV